MIKNVISRIEQNADKNWNYVKSEYTAHLQSKGVKLPGSNSQGGWILRCLADDFPNFKIWSKDSLTKVIQALYSDSCDVQKMRHLANQDGFNIAKGRDPINPNLLNEFHEKADSAYGKNGILKRGFYYLQSLMQPHRVWRPESRTTNQNDIQQLKNQQRFCQTCWAEEGILHPRYGGLTQLQNGHCNNLLPLKGDNIILVCSHCNTNFKDYCVNTDGIPNAISNKTPFIRSAPAVQRDCIKWWARNGGKENILNLIEEVFGTKTNQGNNHETNNHETNESYRQN